MAKPKFIHRENKEHKTEDGPVWASRSVALLGIVFFSIDGKTYVLAEKRSEKMDAPGLWCVPCGYIDWDENATSGLTREIYEETGLFLPDLNPILVNKDIQPFYIHTEPNENRQNITLSYSMIYSLDNDKLAESELNKFRDIIWAAENFKSDEVKRVKLINVSNLKRYPWAFNHNERIDQAMEHVLYKLSEPEILEMAIEKAAELKEISEIMEIRKEFATFSFWKKLRMGWYYKGILC